MNALVRSPQPSTSYAEACERFEYLLSRDSDAVDPLSRARLLTPGHKVERAVVFFHGLSNAPRQFDRLSERFTQRGYSVFIPRIPYHGYLDRMTTDLSHLDLRQLVDFTAASIDLAAGLADEITVSGISLGGVLAVWAAQYRPVAVAAPIAPAIGVPVVPVSVSNVVFGAMGRLPNRFVWWDPRKKQQLPGPTYAYPRFSTHALVATQKLGQMLLTDARTERPAAQCIWMISNAADYAVSNPAGATLVRRWRATGAPNVNAFRFPRHLKLFHDVVDPLQPGARPNFVHPILEQVIVDGSPPLLLDTTSAQVPSA
jgi:alpha-beta hydrolase superfamily lysophospholipase